MNSIGIIAALPAEGRLLCRHFGLTDISPRIPLQLSPQLSLYIAGIGPASARKAARVMLEYGADGLLSWGCAAGLVADCKPGTLFLPTRIINAREQSYTADSCWHERLGQRLVAAGIAHRQEALASSAELLTSRSTKQALAERTGALLADMESAEIAQLASQYETPFLCIRTVADNLDLQLPQSIIRLLNEFGRPDPLRLLGTVLVNPMLVPALIRAGRAFSAACYSLGRVIQCDRSLGAMDSPGDADSR